MAESKVYLFTGPEAGEKSDAINVLREDAVKKNGSIDEYKYYATDTRITDVVSQLRNASLFSPALFIVLRNAESIKLKSDTDLLSDWVKASSDSPNVLVLVSDENSVDKKLESKIPAANKKIFWEMFENQKPQWLQNFLRKNGYSADAEAIELILDMVENNTESLRSECSRFFYCFEKGHRISVSDVEKILAHNRTENAFTLFEAMADSSRSPVQRLETSLDILQKIRASRDSNSVALISGLLYSFRQLRTWHVLHSGSKTPSEQELRAAGFIGKKNQARYMSAARVWGFGTVSSIIALLDSSDIENRETGAALEDTRLFMAIYSIVIKNGLFFSEYSDF